MLLSHEAKLELAKKSILTEPLSINVAQAWNSILNVNTAPSFEFVPQFNGNCAFRGGRGFNRGIGGRFGGRFKVHCQICYKTGHDASVCYHKHSTMMPTPNQWSYSDQNQGNNPAQNQWQKLPSPNWNQWTNTSTQQSSNPINRSHMPPVDLHQGFHQGRLINLRRFPLAQGMKQVASSQLTVRAGILTQVPHIMWQTMLSIFQRACPFLVQIKFSLEMAKVCQFSLLDLLGSVLHTRHALHSRLKIYC